MDVINESIAGEESKMLSSSKPQNSNNRDYPNNYSRQSAVQNAPPSDPVRDRLQANLRAANSSLERRNAAKENLSNLKL